MHEIAVTAQHVHQRRDFISGKPESPTREHARVFFKNLVGEARLDEALPDGEEKKGLIARGRDHGRYEHVRINDGPDHFFFSRL